VNTGIKLTWTKIIQRWK